MLSLLFLQAILICCTVTANLRPKSAIPTFFPFDDHHLTDIFPNQVGSKELLFKSSLKSIQWAEISLLQLSIGHSLCPLQSHTRITIYHRYFTSNKPNAVTKSYLIKSLGVTLEI